MKLAKRIVVVNIVSALLFGAVYLTLFTTKDLPQDSESNSRSALVLKYYRPAYLKPGDWIP